MHLAQCRHTKQYTYGSVQPKKPPRNSVACDYKLNKSLWVPVRVRVRTRTSSSYR